jgi:uncharacterized protein (DUF1015 family)
VDRALNGWSRSAPAIDVVYEGVHNRVWTVDDPRVIGTVQQLMQTRQALIADGHHRYETALAYRDLMKSSNPHHTGTEAYNFMMIFFTNVDDPGLVIYPTHRVIHSLPSFDAREFLSRASEDFILRSFEQPKALEVALASSSVPSFGLTAAGLQGSVLLSLKPAKGADSLIRETLPPEVKELDVSLLHRVLLRDRLGISMESQEAKTHIEYVRNADEAMRMVSSGAAQLAFLMNATKIQQVRRVAKAGHTMPQKSTYFYPKLLSGLVINSLSDDDA